MKEPGGLLIGTIPESVMQAGILYYGRNIKSGYLIALTLYLLKFLAIKAFVTSVEYMIDYRIIISYDWDIKIPAG